MRHSALRLIFRCLGGFLFLALVVEHFSTNFTADVTAFAEEQPSPESGPPRSEATPRRVYSGLLALYDFASSSGPVVKDRSGVGIGVDLQISETSAVNRSAGSLQVIARTQIRTEQPPTKIIESIRRSGGTTIEAWVQPARLDQQGPARIVTLSRSSNERNFTLGQDGNRVEVRYRTTDTTPNGLPSVRSPRRSLKTNLTHIVYTRDRSGRARIYLDGRRMVQQVVSGGTVPWHGSFQLALANELNNSRPWLGTFFLVAIYGRELSAREVEQNYRAGAHVEADPVVDRSQISPSEQFFQNHIAPLLARRCLECHDSISKEGGLDLSQRDAAQSGGESGPVVEPGKPLESLLWEVVETDSMPADRDPLSGQEKNLLKKWITDGAVWSVPTLDPSLYVVDGRATDIWLQRLTLPEYIETVRHAVGVNIDREARELLPADLRADGFSNTAYNLTVDLKHVDAYARLAEIIVEKLDVIQFAAKYERRQEITDKNMRGLIERMGKWLFRGPLEEYEIVAFRGISTTVASAGGNFEEAVRCILEAMLQSPRFIYRIENQRGDGAAWPVGDYELASRLSYIIWGGPPDRSLMKAADSGDLSDQRVVQSQVRRMLKHPRAVARSEQFIREWLDLDRLNNLRPDPRKFPDWNQRLAQDMSAETLAFFRDVVWQQNRPLSDLLNAQVTFLTPRLAKHYGLSPRGEDLHNRYELETVPSRGGLLTQGSILTVGGDEASMVSRGLFVLRDILRGTVNDPPPCVDTTPVPTKAGLTQRGIAEARIADASCGGCHARFEPLAFGLEKFDGLGTFHTHDEHGNALREDGQILIPGSGESMSYETSAQLMDLLAESERVRECMTWKLAQFALGRPLVAADAPILAQVHDSAQKDGGTYASLITAIVLSDLVQLTRTEPAQ